MHMRFIINPFPHIAALSFPFCLQLGTFTISWEPVDNAVYYNLWYRLDGTDTMRYKRIEAPACSAKLTVISTVDTTLHVSLYALTTADNYSASAYKGLSLTGVAGGINYGLWEYQPGDYFTDNKCECAVHTTNIECKKTYTDGDTVIELGAAQCFGFARYAQYEMYGVTSYKDSASFSKIGGLSYANMDKESLRELITEAGVGAHLRTGSSSTSKWGHSMIITNITEEGFSIIQCNGRNNDQGFSYEACRIGTYTYTWDNYMNDSYGKRGIEYIEYYNK